MIAKDAYPFLIPLLVATSTALFFQIYWLSGILLVGAAFVAWFFRNPERVIPQDPLGIVSPGDGKVIKVESREDGTFLSIFLSVFNVHINRAPIAGTLTQVEHRSGRFLAAFDHRASVENERLLLTIENDGRRLSFALVAGLVARRIVPWKKAGEVVAKGDRIGLIRFGSRVDIILPADCSPSVQVGDRVSGGATIIARWRSDH